MPVIFTRLRIAGFKSFAEPVSVEILPGLTGIVGPNGCGKSNVIEALRWTMGESSARSLRGMEMDDLIFAGTASRPARNLAEVVLTLENAAGLAPPPLHDQPELQISRRIERGAGSAYRINGREARARDVQTLFADLATGARSSAMISQGRVAAIVSARPEERRSVLEEAAGITGLHARRHEAELKLHATEANLARADDLLLQLDVQMRSLARQAGEAGRYRTVAAQLRQSESDLLALLHARATRMVSLAGTARIEAVRTRDAAERALDAATRAEQRTAGGLQALRDAEAIARTLLERRRVEAENAAHESERAARDAEQAQSRLRQAGLDFDTALARQEDAATEARRLADEQAALDDASANLPYRIADAETGLAAARDAIGCMEREMRTATAAAIEATTRRAEHARDMEAERSRLERAAATLAGIEAERAHAEAALPDAAALDIHDLESRDVEASLRDAEEALDRAIGQRADAVRTAQAAGLANEDAIRRHHAAVQVEREATARADRLGSEAAALQACLEEAERNLVPDAERDRAHAAVTAAEQALSDASSALDSAEAAGAVSVSGRVDAEARRQDGSRAGAQAAGTVAQADAALARARTQHAQLARDHAVAVAAGLPPDILDAVGQARVATAAALRAIEDSLASAEADHEAATAHATLLADALTTLREASGRLAAEADGLAQALAASADPDAPSSDWPALGELLDVPAGLEAAVAVCLADGLDAACVPEAPQTWLSLPELPAGSLPEGALPEGAVPLCRLMTAPHQLGRALSQAGLIDEAGDGAALQVALRPGQCLVTRAGALWRWDGYRITAGHPSLAATRLQQRARLRETLARLSDAEDALAPAIVASNEAQVRRDQSAHALQALRQARLPAEQALTRARDQESRLAQQEAQARARVDSLAPQRVRSEAALVEAVETRDRAGAALEALPAQASLDDAEALALELETGAVAAEQRARTMRGEADAALRQARAGQAALSSRHAAHETARRLLVPAVARLCDEAQAAGMTLDQARRSLAATAPEDATRMLAEAQAEADRADAAEHHARIARDVARMHGVDCQARRDRAAGALRDGRGRIDVLDARRVSAGDEHEAARLAVEALAIAGLDLPDAALAGQGSIRAEATLAAARDEERVCAQALSDLASERAAVAARRAPLAATLADWRLRLDAAFEAAAGAERRLGEAKAEATAHQAEPALAAASREAVDTALAGSETAHREAESALAAAGETARQTQSDRRTAEAALSAAREEAVRIEAREEQARAILAQLLAETPEPPGTISDDLSDSAEATLRRRVARLIRERDEIGPVNLRAELELAEANGRIAAITHEREEIATAISRLRGQIEQVNREGRERLVAVFEQVDRHFQTIFARMFSGGRAHLGLVGSDDPLTAGLEIYAQPPGKKLATLSLLSGGEQALTALSLVFAVFRCNPAPVCVLDEVDAPLDDANVERFCALLGDMVRETGTRFLVVTHHQLSMAHMDRLYGVTMQERGVSRVLSVDLAMATAMIE